MFLKLQHKLIGLRVVVRYYTANGEVDADVNGRRAVAFPDERGFTFLPIWADTGEEMPHWVWCVIRNEVRRLRIKALDDALAAEKGEP
jgi:hypothetical protein